MPLADGLAGVFRAQRGQAGNRDGRGAGVAAANGAAGVGYPVLAAKLARLRQPLGVAIQLQRVFQAAHVRLVYTCTPP